MCTIVEEEPYVAVVEDPYLKDICSYCFQRAPSGLLKKCSRCQLVHYCNKECQKNDFGIHKHECSFIVNSLFKTPNTKLRLMGRLLIRKYKGDSTSVKAFNGRCFDDLMDHAEDVQKSGDYFQCYTSLCVILPHYVGEKFTVQAPEILSIYGRIIVNSFGIITEELEDVGEAIYLGLSALDHSCDPDANVLFRGRTAILRTAKSAITQFSNQITISYINPMKFTKERRERLKKQYFFKCNCKVCTDPLRDGYARSLKCQKCPMGVCLVIESLQVLTCDQCGAVDSTSIDEAFRMNEEVEQRLKERRQEEKNGKNDIFLNLQSDMALFAKYDNILSRYNLSLAVLAMRIVKMSRTLGRRDLEFKHTHKLVDAYRRYLPKGHPLLTAVIQNAAFCGLFEDPPTRRSLLMFEEALAACHFSHGPGSIMDELNQQIEMFRTRLRAYNKKIRK